MRKLNPKISEELIKTNTLLQKRNEQKKSEEIENRLQKLYKERIFKRKIIQTNTESWLAKHGKTQYIQFDKAKKSNLRKCFLSIDLNGSKSIELEEIIEAMLTLGIAESKAQAKQIFKEVDINGNGHIEFNEFLLLLKNKNPRVKALTELFNNVIERKMGFESDMLPFQLAVSNYRRKMIMNAVMEPGNQKAEHILRSTSQVFTRKFNKLKRNLQKNKSQEAI
ncbi:hypothetical protein SteCoe_29698 [Stentor coeruleus]|uniref:EF-hand domain-containing protein n=1 Tax=Stentor coeruleus TaxID=5963 RepID=A0A1R2B594_9CILI|nr:hypothetical protein SteCoe_29698 [Stentor coeruleus]